MYHFLMPVDRDGDRVTAQADFIIEFPIPASERRVTILYVLPRADASIQDETGFEGNEAAMRGANRLEGYGMEVDRRVRAGTSIPAEILMIVEHENVDQIVMAGRKRSDVAKAVLGSTVTAVMRQTDRPVVLVG